MNHSMCSCLIHTYNVIQNFIVHRIRGIWGRKEMEEELIS